MMQLRSAAVTGPGRVRQVNQDRYLVSDNRLFVVADGMGGHRGGEVAAQLTVDTFTNASEVLSSDDLESAIVEANRIIFQHAADDPELSGMGTTVTAIALLENADEPLLSIANVGDSRTYRFTASGLEQLTEDHSVIGELMRDGRITAEEALQHRHRSVITRALGVEPSVDVDIIEVIPSPGDRYLLCSDGLYSEVADSAIASILRRFADPKEACEELMAAAMRGGRDNITVVIVDVVDDSDPAYRASLALGATAAAGDASTGSSNVLATATGTDAHRTAVGSPTPSGDAAKKAKAPKVKKARKPSPINLRVLLFIAVLAGLGAIVAWVWKNAPESDIVPTSTVVTTDAVVPAGPVTPTTTPDPSTSDPTASTSSDATTGTTTPGTTTPGATTPGATTPGTTNVGTPAVGAATSDGAVAPTTALAPTTTDPFGDPPNSNVTTTRKKTK